MIVVSVNLFRKNKINTVSYCIYKKTAKNLKSENNLIFVFFKLYYHFRRLYIILYACRHTLNNSVYIVIIKITKYIRIR